MSRPTVVSLCDRSGNMVQPWAEAGYSCVCYDLQHSIRADRVEGNVTYRWADIRSLTVADFPAPSIVFAFPPCTNLAVSGARDFQRKGLRGLIDGLELVEAARQLCENSRAPWMLENPVSRLSSCWREPDYSFDPCDYGDPYTKQTCIWAGGGFVMPPQIPKGTTDLFGNQSLAVEPTLGSIVTEGAWAAPGADRANVRSQTPMGFAYAVFAANHPVVQKRRAA
jgi:hypothetical protein